MGWLIGWRTKEELVRYLIDQTGSKIKIIDHSVVGNTLYMVAQFPEAYSEFPEGYRFIMVCLLTGGPRGTGPDGRDWGYKDMGESAGPYRYDCPERLLKQSDCTREAAVSWRESCRQWRRERIAHKKWLDSLKHGDVFYAGEHKLTFVNPKGLYRVNKNYIVGRAEDGVDYRWKKNRASPNPPKEERT